MVSSLGTGMSGLTLNDRDDTQVAGARFNSYEYDDREINASGSYNLDDGHMGEVMENYKRIMTGEFDFHEEAKGRDP